jgi:hypothetical protein
MFLLMKKVIHDDLFLFTALYLQDVRIVRAANGIFILLFLRVCMSYKLCAES